MAGKRAGKRVRKLSFATQAIHAGQDPDPTTGAVMQPIYQVSTYRQPGLGEGWKYDYARTINPTRAALERNLAALEGGAAAHCFASGMSAISAVMHLLRSGDHVVVSRNVYGGTYRLFEGLLRQFGLDFTWVDSTDLDAIARAVTARTKMLYVETPTNPVLGITDLAGAARIARKHRLRLVVDNTFMSPFFQRPIELGADIVVHSTTKYLNGHSDSVGGCAVTTRADDVERIGWIQNSVGAILAPVDSFLVLRGIKTLPIRMQRHDASARMIADWLAERRQVRAVFYPGMKSHPQHALAKRQMSGFGGMISFELGSLGAAKRFLGRLTLCALAESLGGVETLISHPATMTHGSVPKKDRQLIGVTDGLVRISVGLEDPDDLIADLDQALASIQAR
ncbi:MAG TPA: PLP-dependent aspartate aminotransferase family protein [Candidatus Polarisedimenticolaceae bacterium]|nr:PLP-dependent aspartate aminotransferase family protein [Candidatus Polarisedimenticolaceae bacterium]